MGFLDALKGLTRPYDEDMDFFDDEEELFDDEEEEVQQQPAAKAPGARRSTNPFFSTAAPEYDEPEEEEEAAPAARPSFMPRKKESDARERRMPPARNSKVVFINPEKFEDAKIICDHLLARSIIIVSLDNLNREAARRILDFMSGATYATEGTITRTSPPGNTYIITPKNVELTGIDIIGNVENTDSFF